MSKNKQITHFFKKLPKTPVQADKKNPKVDEKVLSEEKSPLKDVTNSPTDKTNMLITTPDSKRIRIDSNEGDGKILTSPAGGGLLMSPEQKDRMDKNKVEAKRKRVSSQLPLVSSSMGVSWFKALEKEFEKPYFKQLNDFMVTERSKYTIFPVAEDVWSWTRHTTIQDVRVVILGQDPYHGPGQAHGLCFSVQPGIPSPPSLINMYKELEADIEGFTRPSDKGGYLAGWADQGVLLLNAVLTVRSGAANSHKDKGWEKLTDAVIKWISDNCTDVIFLLWGAYAQKKAAMVDKRKHHLLKSVHPSPLSAHRGFLGCKHFSQCNEILAKLSKDPIDWGRLPQIKDYSY